MQIGGITYPLAAVQIRSMRIFWLLGNNYWQEDSESAPQGGAGVSPEVSPKWLMTPRWSQQESLKTQILAFLMSSSTYLALCNLIKKSERSQLQWRQAGSGCYMSCLSGQQSPLVYFPPHILLSNFQKMKLLLNNWLLCFLIVLMNLKV